MVKLLLFLGKLRKLLLFLAKKQYALLALLVVAVAVAGTNYYLLASSQNELQRFRNDPQVAIQQENKKLISKIGQLVELPQGEEPTVATVTDETKFKKQAFFAKAQNGDKILIYTKAKKAILYSVSQNKVLEFGPVNIGSSTPQVAGSKTSTQEKK